MLEECLKYLSVSDAVWSPTKDNRRVQVYFTVALEENDNALHYLNSMGFGLKKDTEIGFIPFSLYYNEEDQEDPM